MAVVWGTMFELTLPHMLRHDATIAVMAKPLRCLLRLHKWEDRENPETQEHYRICVRCNAYRDRGTSPWGGSGGAWGIGGGIGG